MEKNQVYRANVAAMIVNTKGEFLLTQLIHALQNEWDFVKGGMNVGEEHIDTLHREIREELGELVKFQVLQRSNVPLIYDWTKEMQQRKGFRGQARVSYWVLYEDGEIVIDTQELKAYKWVPCNQVAKILDANRFPEFITKSFMDEWGKVKSLISVTY